MVRVPQATRRSPRASRERWIARRAGALFFLCVSSTIADGALAHRGHETERAEPVVLAPGYGTLEYEAPIPGSYSLPVLSDAANGMVLTANGSAVSLHTLYGDRIAVLSFVYASCNDVNGCPLATAVLHRLRSQVQNEFALAEHLQLVSLSFDPTRDTPAVMTRYGKGFRGPGPPWAFATSASSAALAPILEAYGQSVQPEYDEQGLPIGTLSHVLRVFLIDRQKRIRNIYSVSQLHSDTLVADVRTLLLEEENETSPSNSKAGASSVRDPRRSYADPSFATQSVRLAARRGIATDLVEHAYRPRPGYGPVPEPRDNPLNAERVALGRRLFFDRRLSVNGTLSCAMCHIPEQGFTNNELATPVGTEGRGVRRNAPTLLDVAYRRLLFHDGRETRLEDQVWSPLLAKNEMANPSAEAVVEKIRATSTYERDFRKAFPSAGLAKESVGFVLASYQRTLVSGPAPFDRWRYGGETEAISGAAKRGFELFVGKAGCQRCHTVGARTATFDDGAFHNIGVGGSSSPVGSATAKEVVVAPGQAISIDAEVLSSLAKRAQRPPDLGRYEVTQAADDRRRFRTPTLRNVALTAPYMHDGSLQSLSDVIDHYSRGGGPNPGLDPLIEPIELSDRDRRDLVAFLKTLSGDAVPHLVRDAFAAQAHGDGR